MVDINKIDIYPKGKKYVKVGCGYAYRDIKTNKIIIYPIKNYNSRQDLYDLFGVIK